MRILLIRHGQTAGNREKRYIGRTDEPLCKEGISVLNSLRYPCCEILVSSPMQRCLQTAELLFPGQDIYICEAFRECDFGDFERKNYAELNGNPQYQRWLDSGGTLPFPNGESPDDFRTRSCAGFLQITRKYKNADSIALVVHGGTAMAILSQFALPHVDYFDCMTENAHGWQCDFDGVNLINTERL